MKELSEDEDRLVRRAIHKAQIKAERNGHTEKSEILRSALEKIDNG